VGTPAAKAGGADATAAAAIDVIDSSVENLHGVARPTGAVPASSTVSNSGGWVFRLLGCIRIDLVQGRYVSD
jgi:hypothetical protein